MSNRKNEAKNTPKDIECDTRDILGDIFATGIVEFDTASPIQPTATDRSEQIMNNQQNQSVVSLIETITNHKPDVEMRIARRLEVGTGIQQGDVYVIRMPDKTPHGALRGSNQVALGTNIGARHVAEGPRVRVFESVAGMCNHIIEGFSENQITACAGPIVEAEEPWVLTHPEHAHHTIPAGTFQVFYQWDEVRMGRVAD